MKHERLLRKQLAGSAPVFFIIAGPNGAGKSTFSKSYVTPNRIQLHDPDAISRELFGPPPVTSEESREASIEADRRTRTAFEAGISVALETVFSDNGGHKEALLKLAAEKGYTTCLIYIGLSCPELCSMRVEHRFKVDGLHDVADEYIFPRYKASLENLKRHIRKVDQALIFDNSSMLEGAKRHVHIATYSGGVRKYLRADSPAWFLECQI